MVLVLKQITYFTKRYLDIFKDVKSNINKNIFKKRFLDTFKDVKGTLKQTTYFTKRYLETLKNVKVF